MSGIAICLASLVLGIDVGWQPLPGGGMEYIIQIEPGTLDALRPGEAIESQIPPEVRDVRAYRIVVGNQKLPTKLPEKKKEPAVGPSLGKLWEPPSKTASGGKSSAPFTLPMNPESKPLERPAGFNEPLGDTSHAAAKLPTDASPSIQPPKPWLLLWAIILGLCASVTGNVYLGWIFWELRRRCRTMAGLETPDRDVLSA